MAVSKQQKIEILNNLIKKIKNAKSIGFAKTTTITVEEFSNIRNDLRKVWATYTLAKKTLIKKALKETLNIEISLSTLPGQIWILCSNEDSIGWLSKLNWFVKKNKNKIEWVSSIIDWELKNLEETKIITNIPSKDTLLGRFVWSLQSPLSSLTRFFDIASKNLKEKWKEKIKQLELKNTEEKKEKPKKEKTEKK